MVGPRRHRGGEAVSPPRPRRSPSAPALAAAAALGLIVAGGLALAALVSDDGPAAAGDCPERDPRATAAPDRPPATPTRPSAVHARGSDPALSGPGNGGSEMSVGLAGTGGGRRGPASHLFSSDRTGSYQIHLAPAGASTGDAAVALTDDHASDHWWPRLSPDGSMVLFSRTPAQPLAFGTPGGDETEASLWTMRPDGSGITERIPADAFGRMGPARWSPDGRHVVFAATDPADGRYRLWVADTERFDSRPVTDGGGVVLDPAFSPDGTRLAYVAHPPGHRGDPTATATLEVFVLDLERRPDGGEPDEARVTRLTDDLDGDRSPTWSSDGRLLAVATEMDPDDRLVGRWALRLVSTTEPGAICAPSDRRVDPAPPRATIVLSDGAVNLAPAWDRSGTALVFQRFPRGGDGFGLAAMDLAMGRPVPLGPPGPHNDVHVELVTGPPAWP